MNAEAKRLIKKLRGSCEAELMELEELLLSIGEPREQQNKTRKAEAASPHTKSTVSAKSIADREGLQNELNKKQKEEGESKGVFTGEEELDATTCNAIMPKVKSETKNGAPKEKVRRRRRTTRPALLIKPN